MGVLLTPRLLGGKPLDASALWAESLGGGALRSVSPARYAGSSFTCAERSAAQAFGRLRRVSL